MPNKVKTVNKPNIYTEVTIDELIYGIIEDIRSGQPIGIL